jgi:Rv2525c-like, glycoside hydrolase-like domain
LPIVVDFAWTKPTVEQLHAWGAVAVGMYVSRDPAKNATPQLVDEYAAAGIKTILFFEDAADQATRGYAQGKADAEFTRAQAEALGKPGWAPVLAAVDFDLPDYAPASADPLAKLGPVGEYFHGWNETLTPVETGGYGDYWAISRLSAAHLITAGVQTVAWSGGKVDTRHIACLQNGQTLDGGNVDVELIEPGNLLARLAWVPGETKPGEVPAVTHPADGAWLSKGMLSLAALATGTLRTTVSVVLETTLKHAGQFPPELAAYLDAGNLDAAKMPPGTVVWYPKAAQ